MTKDLYNRIKVFPIEMVSLTRYEADKTNLNKGDLFIGVSKKSIGAYDHSIIDHNGHPHYYEWCNPLYPDEIPPDKI